MPLSTLLHLEYDPVEPTGAMKHLVFSCQQTKGPNLEVLPTTASLRFAVMYTDALDDRLIEALEQAYASGALSPVKLIAVEENKLHVFLDAAVTSATFPMIESLWASVVETEADEAWTVSFATETEALSGYSDFRCWDDAKEVLESYPLGIESLSSSACDSTEHSIRASKKDTHPDVASELEDTLAAGNVCPQTSSRLGHQDQSPFALSKPWIDKSLFARQRLLSNTELMPLGNTVHSCKSPRDACLRAMLMSNIRMVELTSIKVEDISISKAAVKVQINASKSHRSMHRFLAPSILPKLLRTYVQEYHLSPKDYLFPSATDASKPLSIREVKVVFNRWLRDAQIEREQLTPSSIRSSSAHPCHSLTLQRIAEMMGHVSQPKTLDYISLFHQPQNQ